MSTEGETTEMIPFDPVFLKFKRHKVMISNAIKKPFPFLEVLRDNSFITEKMYTDFEDSCTNLVPVQKVVYRALEELEKKFGPNVLEVLFSPGNLMEYPDLELISKDFENEWRSNDGEKNTLSQGNQTENHQFSISQIHNESCELKVQLSDRDAGLEPNIPLPCSNERAELPSHGIKIFPCSVNPVNIKQENSSVFLSSEHQTHTRPKHNKASEIIDLTRDNSDDKNSCSEESTPVTCQSNMSDTDSSSTRKRQRRTSPRYPRQNNVDFNLPELPVKCGTAKGILYKEKFKKGTHEKSIWSETREWLTLRDFEIRGGHEKSKNWKKSIQCYGWTLGYLIEKELLPNPQRKKEKNSKLNNLEVTVGIQSAKTLKRNFSTNDTNQQPQQYKHTFFSS